MRYCATCGSQLGPFKQSNAKYCSNACRQAAYRNDQVALARQALGVLSPPSEDLRLIASGDMNPGLAWQDRLAFLRLHYPTIWSTFGEDALAAAARPLPAGSCQWCWAYALAVRGNRKDLLLKASTTVA